MLTSPLALSPFVLFDPLTENPLAKSASIWLESTSSLKLTAVGVQLSSISVSAIIEAIPLLSDEVLEYPVTAYPSGERHRTSTELWELVEKHEKDERKREKKWEKQHPKPKNIKEAERNFDCIVDKLMRG